jgi:hypothetical protein
VSTGYPVDEPILTHLGATSYIKWITGPLVVPRANQSAAGDPQ